MKKPNYSRLKNHISLFLFTITILGASCSSKTEKQIPEVSKNDDKIDLSELQFNSAELKLGKIEKSPFRKIVKANGILNALPQNQASVNAYFGGTVKELQLTTGQKIKKGEVLFSLENPEFIQLQQDYLEAKGQLAYLEPDYMRQKNLIQDQVASQKNFLKAEADYTVTKIRFESLDRKLALINIDAKKLTLDNIRAVVNIVSPIGGYVTEINIAKGSLINPAETAVKIVNTDNLHLELNVFEKDLAKIEIGQTIQFSLQDNQDEEYKAIVHFINKIVDPEKRTIIIQAVIKDAKIAQSLSLGMYVEADIYTSSETKASLPEDALVEVDGKYYVLILDEKKGDDFTFSKKEVQKGITQNAYSEILNFTDFQENTDFIVKGAFNLIQE